MRLIGVLMCSLEHCFLHCSFLSCVLLTIICHFVFPLLTIARIDLLYTDSDYTFGIFKFLLHSEAYSLCVRGCRGRDRMVVGFTTTYAISACHH